MKTEHEGPLTLECKGGRFSFLANDGKLGWKDIGIGITTDHDFEALTATECTEAADGGMAVSGSYVKSGLRETISFSLRPNRALVVVRKITNPGKASVLFAGACAGRIDRHGAPSFGENSVWRARYCHLDNLRTEKYPRCRPEYPYVRTLPWSGTWLGGQESQAAPVLLLTNDSYSQVLVEGQLGQELTRMRWRLAASREAHLFAEYLTDWDFHNSGGTTLNGGGSVELEPIFYQILESTHPQDALGDYFAEVVARNELRQEGNVLHSKAFYCSWNYGIMADICEASLLKTARFISENLPGIKHFLIDDGWQKPLAVPSPDRTGFYLDENERYNKEKFPSGMKVMADKLREAGVSPAIWWTPSVSSNAKLAQDKPEWLAKDARGAPYRIGHSGCLDYSLPEVRDYFESVFDTIFNQWGYEAMKMDFWCQGVESDQVRYREGTGIQWRDWLLSTIRKHLPDDGFLMTCVATAMGNPFLGKHAHTYRACIDVGNFTRWDEHLIACSWVQGMLPFPGRETCIMNVDGLGVSTHRPDHENLHRLTYGFITMGSLEVDGRLEELDPRHVEWLRRLTTNIDRGYPCKTVDDAAFTGAPYPRVLYVDYPTDSPTRKRGVKKHVALLNWSDDAQFIGATDEQLGLEGATTVRDFWTDEETEFGGNGLCERLDGRSAKFYEIGG